MIHRGVGSAATAPGLTKIVATIGPKSEQLPMLSQLVTAGVRIMRINFSHATYEEADLRVKNLRLSRGMNSTTNLRAVLLDTQGPEIRTGMFANVKEVELKTGQQIVLSIDDSLKETQTSDRIWISYKKLLDTVKEGSLILLDDGAIEVKVEKKNVAGGEITCTVVNSGTLGNKKGVNMPGLSVELPAMSAKDREDIHWSVTTSCCPFILSNADKKIFEYSLISTFTVKPHVYHNHHQYYYHHYFIITITNITITTDRHYYHNHRHYYYPITTTTTTVTTDHHYCHHQGGEERR